MVVRKYKLEIQSAHYCIFEVEHEHCVELTFCRNCAWSDSTENWLMIQRVFDDGHIATQYRYVGYYLDFNSMSFKSRG